MSLSSSIEVTRRLLDGEARIHRLLASGAPLTDSLAALTRLVEDLSPGAKCSILLVDETGSLRTGAAPSLPDEYNAEVDGLVPGEVAGSCGTAAYLGRTVVVSDVLVDPLWAEYRDLAARFGLRSCWSTPIASVPSGEILGTFAIYYEEPKAPSDSELELVERFGHLAAVVIGNSRAQEVARSRAGQLEELLGLTRAINEGRTIEEVLNGVYESFRSMIPYDRMEYAILEDEGRVLRTRWVRADYDHLRLPPDFVHRRKRALASVRESRWHAVIDNDLVSYAATKPEGNPTKLLVAEGIRSALNCPLVLRGEVVGYLFLVSRTPSAYRARHAHLVEQVAAHIAGAVEQHRLREAVVEQNEKLLELQRLRSTFLATVSHELRTPLTAVVGLTAEMRDRIDELDAEEISDFSAMIHQEATDVAGIVEDLLVVARSESDEIALDLQPVDLGAEVAALLASKSAEFADDVAVTGSARKSHADPLRVRQVVRNLLSNSRRHGGPHVSVRLSDSDDCVSLIVADDGEEIPSDLQSRMFHPYAHGEKERTRPGSVGLGLWVARHLAQGMSGDLRYFYENGESCFELTLPVSD